MRKRSKYRQREQILPIVFRFNSTVERNLQLIPHDLLEAMRKGEGSEEGWHSLAARLNTGFILARDNFGDDNVAMMSAALDALTFVFNRNQTSEKWGTTGEEFFAMGNGLNLTDAMQLKCTRRELESAIKVIIPAGALRDIE